MAILGYVMRDFGYLFQLADIGITVQRNLKGHKDYGWNPKSKGVADKKGLLFMHQDGVRWCMNEIRARQKSASTAAASSQGIREQASDSRAEIFQALGPEWVLKVLCALGDIPVSCVTAANERVAEKVLQNEGRQVERLLH